MLKSYIETLLQAIVDSGHQYSVVCENVVLTTRTDDVSLGFGQDEYRGVHAVDDSHIYLYPEDGGPVAWLYWTNYNDDIEKVVDCSGNIDKYIDFDKINSDYLIACDAYLKGIVDGVKTETILAKFRDEAENKDEPTEQELNWATRLVDQIHNGPEEEG